MREERDRLKAGSHCIPFTKHVFTNYSYEIFGAILCSQTFFKQKRWCWTTSLIIFSVLSSFVSQRLFAFDATITDFCLEDSFPINIFQSLFNQPKFFWNKNHKRLFRLFAKWKSDVFVNCTSIKRNYDHNKSTIISDIKWIHPEVRYSFVRFTLQTKQLIIQGIPTWKTVAAFKCLGSAVG